MIKKIFPFLICLPFYLFAGEKIAIIAGIQDYKFLPDINSTAANCRLMETYCLSKKYTTVWMLHDGAADSLKPTMMNLKKTMYLYLSKIRNVEIDELLFYFSGHILSSPSMGNYLCCSDTEIENQKGMLDFEELMPWIACLKPKLTLFILDNLTAPDTFTGNYTQNFYFPENWNTPQEESMQIFAVSAVCLVKNPLENSDVIPTSFTNTVFEAFCGFHGITLLEIAEYLRNIGPKSAMARYGQPMQLSLAGTYSKGYPLLSKEEQAAFASLWPKKIIQIETKPDVGVALFINGEKIYDNSFQLIAYPYQACVVEGKKNSLYKRILITDFTKEKIQIYLKLE